MFHLHTFAPTAFWWDQTPCGYYDFILEGPQPASPQHETQWVPPWLVFTEVSPGVFSDAQGDLFVSSCFGSADEREWVPA